MLYTPLNDQVFLQVVSTPSDSLQMLIGASYARVLAVASGADCSGLKKGDLVIVVCPISMRTWDSTKQYIVTSYHDCVLRVEENPNGDAN